MLYGEDGRIIDSQLDDGDSDEYTAIIVGEDTVNQAEAWALAKIFRGLGSAAFAITVLPGRASDKVRTLIDEFSAAVGVDIKK